MVDKNAYIMKNEVPDLVVWCKSCTRNLDPTHQNMHNLFELRWLRDSYIRTLATVFAGLLGVGTKRWLKPAVDKFYAIGQIRFPEQMHDPLQPD
jgi:hypothetical protein